MDAHPNTVADVFAGQKQYVIPVFQRTYQWGEDRWANLWLDLNSIAEETDRDITHFIGPMVVIANSVVPYDVPKFMVIDGQQRLMTLTILLAALRERAKVLRLSKIADSINQNALLFLNTKGDSVPKIVPRIRDRDSLYNILDAKFTLVDKTLLLAQAYDYFYEQLSQLTPIQPELFSEPNDVILDRLYNAVIYRLKVVLITLDNSDNPSSIYESLNFKQDKLSEADLVRNYVFMKQGSLEEQEKFDNSLWKAFEEIFKFSSDPKLSLSDFYYRYLICETDYLAKKRLYIAFTKYADEYLKLNGSQQLVNRLSRFANFYKYINFKCNDENLEETFARFRQLETDTALPLVLFLYDKYDSKELSKSSFNTMLRSIESFILRRFINRDRTRGYDVIFADARKYCSSPTSLMNYFSGKGFPTDAQVRESLESFEFYKRNSQYCRLVLAEIEKSFGHKEKVYLNDSANVQIEHVMPQELTQSWREMLGKDADDKHESYLHTLGNLTLTGYNLELGTKPFTEKKDEYRKSNIVLNRYFDGKVKWTDQEILERTNYLCDKFVDIWLRPEQAGMQAPQKKQGPKKDVSPQQKLLP